MNLDYDKASATSKQPDPQQGSPPPRSRPRSKTLAEQIAERHDITVAEAKQILDEMGF